MMTSEIKDTIANGVSISALGSALMAWETPLTLLLILTGVILNITRIITFFKKRDQNV